MDGMVKKTRKVDFGDGKGPVPTSLKDLGYNDVGLDDNWQKCGAPDAKSAGNNFHDKDGNPIVNLDLFPSMPSSGTTPAGAPAMPPPPRPILGSPGVPPHWEVRCKLGVMG